MVLMRLYISERKKLHNMMVDSDDRIMVVKEQLKETSGIPVENQDLKWGGKTLDDNKPFKYYGIRAGGFFDLKQK